MTIPPSTRNQRTARAIAEPPASEVRDRPDDRDDQDERHPADPAAVRDLVAADEVPQGDRHPGRVEDEREDIPVQAEDGRQRRRERDPHDRHLPQCGRVTGAAPPAASARISLDGPDRVRARAPPISGTARTGAGAQGVGHLRPGPAAPARSASRRSGSGRRAPGRTGRAGPSVAAGSPPPPIRASQAANVSIAGGRLVVKTLPAKQSPLHGRRARGPGPRGRSRVTSLALDDVAVGQPQVGVEVRQDRDAEDRVALDEVVRDHVVATAGDQDADAEGRVLEVLEGCVRGRVVVDPVPGDERPRAGAPGAPSRACWGRCPPLLSRPLAVHDREVAAGVRARVAERVVHRDDVADDGVARLALADVEARIRVAGRVVWSNRPQTLSNA